MEKKSKKLNLEKAKKIKNDEFYTQLSDIENELKHYKKQFEGKTILMPCDDPDLIKQIPISCGLEDASSQFWVYFHKNFNHLKLKKIIATHYESIGESYRIEYSGGNDNVIYDYKKYNLKGNGDFRSPEVQKLYDKADIIVTNPPFSLFREFVANLFEKDKKFLIIGNKNAVSYKDTFKLFKENKIWFGYTKPNKFKQIINNNIEFKNLTGLSYWFTNLDVKKRYEYLFLHKNYNEEEYPKYDNYDVINIDKVSDIPVDYFEPMGVPITFLDKYNPEQFEILDLCNGTPKLNPEIWGKNGWCNINGKYTYARIFIKRKDKK